MSTVTKHIESFIEFCRDVSDRTSRLEDYTHKKPAWASGLSKFHAMFVENPDGFVKVFDRFITENRQNLETPIFDQSGKPNDKWLKVGKDADVTSEDAGWTRKSKGPRGIVVWLNPDSDKLSGYFLPVSEVYQACLGMYRAKVNLRHTSHDSIPVSFLLKFFQCLDVVEGNNHFFEQNIADAQEELGPDNEIDNDAEESEEVTEKTLEKQAMGMMTFMQGLKPENLGAILDQAKMNPIVRFMAKSATGLEGESLDKFFSEAPLMLSSVQGSIMGTAAEPAVKTILEQESVQEMLLKNPGMATAVKEMTAGAAKIPAVIEPVVGSAEDQD